MTINRLSPNSQELVLTSGARILWSYNEPVAVEDAALVPIYGASVVYASDYISKSTTAHIKDWLRSRGAVLAARAVQKDAILRYTQEAR